MRPRSVRMTLRSCQQNKRNTRKHVITSSRSRRGGGNCGNPIYACLTRKMQEEILSFPVQNRLISCGRIVDISKSRVFFRPMCDKRLPSLSLGKKQKEFLWKTLPLNREPMPRRRVGFHKTFLRKFRHISGANLRKIPKMGKFNKTYRRISMILPYCPHRFPHAVDNGIRVALRWGKQV